MADSFVAIDAGNTRIKWGGHVRGAWTSRGVIATADAAWLRDAAEDWPTDARVVICNVAGAAVADAIGAALSGLPLRPVNFVSSAECCGVSNRYERPSQLGADRWAALVGARSITSQACIVVCAGTATTVDVLDADGVFQGGVILPGFDLMRASLASNTAQLPLAEGKFEPRPRNTVDAIVSGCLQAQAGAIERMFASIAAQPDALCVMTGGAAERLAPHLNIPLRLADNLILDGLVRYGASLPAA